MEARNRVRLLFSLYPDEGPLRRELYPKHIEFFAAGARHAERAFIAGNRVGKSFAIGYEAACHLIGWYPPWWVGRRFDRPIVCWASGEDAKAVRESLQPKLIGTMEEPGTGLIPKANIVNVFARSGVTGSMDYADIRHASGGFSRLVMKCFVAGTKVRMADGTWRSIDAIKVNEQVLCADKVARKVIATHAYADAPILSVRLRSGGLKLTPNHEMFVEGVGRVPACNLKVGDVLEAVTDLDGPWILRQEEWRVKLTALMIGDGCARAKTPFFSCNEPAIVEEVVAALPPGYRVVRVNNTISYKISGSEHKFNILKDSLVKDGLWGKKSKDKHIPGWVFRLPRDQKITFLRWLWGCDGTLQTRSATYTTASLALARDVRLLLWDLGIFAEVKTHLVKLKEKVFTSHYITLTGEGRLRFNEIGKLNRVVECALKPRPNGPPHEILQIEPAGQDVVYCLTVEDAHEFVAEGYRSGNSYDQKRESFQASEVDVVILDEEPPLDIYTEALTRTMSTKPGQPNGVIMCAFTPLKGLSATVMQFLPSGAYPATEEARKQAWGW